MRAGVNQGPARWASAQSPPPILRPRSTGAIRSPLLELLEEGNQGVQLSGDGLRVLACPVDLAVPYGGAYTEAAIWSEEEREEYRRFEEKRRRTEEAERRSIEDWIRSRAP
ncbi:MAG: hypothetical protein ACUVYA_13435 [Planctomycetota bacterium]